MSSKSYTMREMKSIVDYLVENKLYGEFKGRKMWMDFANSKLTNRTWQSLKETFVKRVLPDIHNPYYKLTVEQINSFRSGFDIADRNKAKLEVHTISDDSNSNGLTEVNESPASNGNNHERETTTGENIKCSKIPPQNRSSADTIILEPCYETAEEILKELESNGKDLPASSNVRQTSRSLRDCITYSEPLTPMLQEVLDDFASEPEDSDREGPMHIVEAVQVIESTDDLTQMPETDGTIPKLISLATDVVKSATELSIEGTEEVLAQEIVEIIPENTSPQKQVQNVEPRIEETVNKIGESLKDITENGDEEATEHNKQDNSENVAGLVNGSKNYEISGPKGHQPESLFDSENQTNHNSSGGTVDASLPNNPEGFKDKSQKTDNKLKESPEKLKSSGETSSTSDKKPTVSPPKRKRSATVDPKKLTEIEKKRNKLAGKLKGPLKVSKKAKPRAATETAIKIKDDVCETAELKPTNKDIEELMDLDTIQEIDTNKDVTDIEKPSTSFDMEVTNAPEQPETEQSSKENDVPEVTNPCLQNVSLFDEQFNKTKYNMSESSDTEQNKKETSENTQEGISKHDGAAKPNVDVVVQIPSGSDAEQARSPPKKKHRPVVLPSKAERDKAVANMFGQSGGVSSKRRRQLNRRSRTISHNNVAQTAPHSNSSEWTSESESEAFISPPRSRKNRTTRKYLKPRSARILSLEEEGGLFVMYGKKIFPLIKDGKIVKNYLTYVPESDSEEGESYWKQKYEEEKKKASEFKKLLQKVKVPQEIEAKPPVPPDNLLRNFSINNQVPAITNGNDDQTPFPAEVKQIAPKVHPPEKITIKFTKNNEEVHLEGHWPEIHPVLEQVVHIFHKEVEAPAAAPAPRAPRAARRPRARPPRLARAARTQQGPQQRWVHAYYHHTHRSSFNVSCFTEIHEKVNKIEKEIFKEIEQRDKEEETMPSPRAPVNNVTKRSLVDRKQGRPRKSSSSVTLSPPPQTRVVRQSTSKKSLKITASESEVAENVETAKASPRRQIKTPRKLLNESLNINDGKNIQTRRSRQKLDVSSPDDNVKYMLRPKSLRLSKSPPINKPKTKKQKR
ncbi:unnamed protein product [Chrysodeixis includens]|uniref:Uncharacterized protein n=1 Tax=Chrysodeixis includens TaxID=689277 RepID=A0A9P0BR19_CHRIL|nr:unnamed protein product [Chrysodeixis includens]